jgi:hypothetical protein
MVTINELLKYKHIEHGISLEAQDDVVILLKDNKPEAIFSNNGENLNAILNEADKLLEEK